ncbi:hypothetical protein ABN034_29230 [Actinopolymorpha sp. B11F2]|uniref:hypothetical protein n=1 Tax=Actinopolymorpha sp. B11F2 TaxID=3160862 RepID=UPI0032E4799B
MSELVTKVVVVALILLVIAAAVVPRIRGRRSMAQRVKAMAAVAESQGWTFTAERPDLVPLVQQLPRSLGTAGDMITSKVMRMEPTRLAVGSRILNVLGGVAEGRRVEIFDWLVGHGSGTGRAQLTYLHTVWAVPLPHVPFWVQVANKWQSHDEWRPGKLFRTGDAAFDKRFLTTAEDASHVGAGLTQQTRRLLLESSFDGWRLDPDLGVLLVWTHSQRRYAPADQIVAMTHQVVRLAAEADAQTASG